MASTTTGTGVNVVSVKVELAGGLDLLFENRPKLLMELPATNSADGKPSITVGELITHLSEVVMTDSRKELFVIDGHIRPGIMVLINEADWELEGEEECQLVGGDEVLFVSTLHGG